MSGDEQAILDYLRNWPDLFVSPKEIARKVGGKQRYEEDRFWPLPILQQMTRKGWLEADYLGHYRIRAVEAEKLAKKKKRPVSPQILKILKGSGRNFEEGLEIPEEEPPKPAESKRPPPRKS
ncbi:MAG TPA: hypothetical protein VH598_11850 [Verrucomicrobiae bacterium]|nr:hypothetical protein [Verrucomicrobiae bacterium]